MTYQDGKVRFKETGREVKIFREFSTPKDHVGILDPGEESYHWFPRETWDFIPDRVSTQEQFDKVRVGNRFAVSRAGVPLDGSIYFKINDEQYISSSPSPYVVKKEYLIQDLDIDEID